MLITVLISFVISALLTPVAIPLLKRLKFGQQIREIGPKWHSGKSGTPTMGGIVFIVASTAAVLIVNRGSIGASARLLVITCIAFGAIGFADDMLKVCFKRNLGLRAWQKLLLQLAVSTAFVFTGMNIGILTTQLYIIPSVTVELSWLYIPLAVLFLTFIVNSVNLTDGLDGLAASVTIPVVLFFAIMLSLPYCAAVAGALAGFLIYNWYPAKLFMGDTGSLFLGAVVGAAALISGYPLILLLVGIVYICESLSVMLQVASFKTTGKRIFKMSPIHHHFEMCGRKEVEIVAMFTAITVAGIILAGVLL